MSAEKKGLIPAAQYLRASTERQHYSIAYQAKIISQYAEHNGFQIIQAFSDEARSGISLRYRPALRQLLEEVVRGETPYRAILVFDVSRWGRFQDTDESAHYEYICKSSGIPIHYCAESFSNSGAISDSLLKTLKRFMAGEFSRDLSIRTLGGIKQLVQRGYKYGSSPGYGLRRMLISADGRQKQLLGPGERKSISSDRVIFVPGPIEEQQCVREIYRQFVEEQKPMTEIARQLNRRKIRFIGGGWWSPSAIKLILSHPKYTGTLAFNRTEKKLQNKQRKTDPSQWIVVKNAFQPLVDETTFDAAQRRCGNFTRKKSNQQLLDDLKRLLAENGRLSLDLLRKSAGVASPQTYFARLGSIRNAYSLIGYNPPPAMIFRHHLVSLRNNLINDLLDHFPDEIYRFERKAKYLQLKDGPLVLVRICKSCSLRSGRRWVIGPGCDGSSITLIATMDEHNSQIESMFVLPHVQNREYWVRPNGALLRTGVCLETVSDFCSAVRTVQGRKFQMC
jgi:DNA invertase Pin-like site-specific DNA recombinase